MSLALAWVAIGEVFLAAEILRCFKIPFSGHMQLNPNPVAAEIQTDSGFNLFPIHFVNIFIMGQKNWTISLIHVLCPWNCYS